MTRVERPSLEAILGDHQRRLRTTESALADPREWIYVGSGAPAPDFQNGFFNVGSPLVLLRYRFLRPYDPTLDPNTINPIAVQIQGSVAGGSAGLTIFTLKYPQTLPDGTAAWVVAKRDYDIHLTCCDDAGNLVIVTVQGATGDVIYGFV